MIRHCPILPRNTASTEPGVTHSRLRRRCRAPPMRIRSPGPGRRQQGRRNTGLPTSGHRGLSRPAGRRLSATCPLAPLNSYSCRRATPRAGRTRTPRRVPRFRLRRRCRAPPMRIRSPGPGRRQQGRRNTGLPTSGHRGLSRPAGRRLSATCPLAPLNSYLCRRATRRAGRTRTPPPAPPPRLHRMSRARHSLVHHLDLASRHGSHAVSHQLQRLDVDRADHPVQNPQRPLIGHHKDPVRAGRQHQRLVLIRLRCLHHQLHRQVGKFCMVFKISMRFSAGRPKKLSKGRNCWGGLVLAVALVAVACSSSAPQDSADPTPSDRVTAVAQPDAADAATPVALPVSSPTPEMDHGGEAGPLAAAPATPTLAPVPSEVPSEVATPEPVATPVPSPTEEPSAVPVASGESVWEVDLEGVPAGGFEAVSAGWDFACGIRVGGGVECWGERWLVDGYWFGFENDFGQLNAPEGEFTAISSGATHSCGIKVDRALECWGDSFYSRLEAPGGEFTAVDASRFHSCAIRVDRTVVCWGLRRYGLLDAPRGEFTAVDAGWYHTCGLGVDGAVVCWGDAVGEWHGLGPDGEFIVVDGGWPLMCGRQVGGAMVCWGDSVGEWHGGGPTGEFTAVATSRDGWCGLHADGSVECWGMYQSHSGVDDRSYEDITGGGYRFCGTRSDRAVECGPLPDTRRQYVSRLDGEFEMVSVGGWLACGVRKGGAVECWIDVDGRDGVSVSFDLAGSLASGAWSVVSAGGFHTCAIRTDRTVACWGDNEFGQSDAPDGSFISVSAGVDHTCTWTPWPSVHCSGGYHSCGVRVGGAVVCWGDNELGQTDAPAGEFAAVSAGGTHSCGLRTDRAAVCWGGNEFGQSDAPAGEFISVAAGGTHSCGVRVGGELECWGNNEYGRANAPAGEFASVTAWVVDTCAHRTDRAIVCWPTDLEGLRPPEVLTGLVDYSIGLHWRCGILNDGTLGCSRSAAFHEYAPTDPAPPGVFTAVSRGIFHTCGLRLNETLECWGDFSRGQLDMP